jgi:hypothetical protein
MWIAIQLNAAPEPKPNPDKADRPMPEIPVPEIPVPEIPADPEAYENDNPEVEWPPGEEDDETREDGL